MCCFERAWHITSSSGVETVLTQVCYGKDAMYNNLEMQCILLVLNTFFLPGNRVISYSMKANN